MKGIIAAATIFAGTARGQSYGGPPNTSIYPPKGSRPSVPHVRAPGQYADPYPETPRHHADDYRQCKSGGAPCCTAHFERQSGYGKSYTMEPAFNQRLFMDECPAKKTDEAICEAAAKKFTKFGTSLGQKTDYHPKGFVYKKPKKPRKQPVYAYEADDVAAAEAAVTEYKKEIFRVDDPLIVKGEWWSDTKADIAVITTGCCSNVFPDVKAGDKLDTMCENDVIGDPNDLYNLGRYSVVTPGRLRIGCSPVERRLSSQSRRRLNRNLCAVPFSMIVGGAFERGLVAISPLQIAIIEATPVQYWAEIGVAALGSISDDWTGLNTGTNIGQRTILSEDWTGTFTADEEIISLTERGDSITLMEARVCAYSDLLSSLERTEGATVENTPGEVEIDCSAGVGSGTCVVDLDAVVFTELVTKYMITLGSFDQLVVNVWQTEVSIRGNVRWTIDQVGFMENRAVIWNFQETESFYFDIRAEGVEVDFVLPRATNVSIKATQFWNSMTVLLGKRESYLDLEGDWDDRSMLLNPLPLPPAEPKITLCSCLCPQEHCYHR